MMALKPKTFLLLLPSYALFMAYRRKRLKIENTRFRQRFLLDCQKNDIIPRFLKFRVPENGCFEERIVHNFQKRLLRREIAEASRLLETQQGELVGIKKELMDSSPRN